jgi:hypothetical protein
LKRSKKSFGYKLLLAAAARLASLLHGLLGNFFGNLLSHLLHCFFLGHYDLSFKGLGRIRVGLHQTHEVPIGFAGQLTLTILRTSLLRGKHWFSVTSFAACLSCSKVYRILMTIQYLATRKIIESRIYNETMAGEADKISCDTKGDRSMFSACNLFIKKHFPAKKWTSPRP